MSKIILPGMAGFKDDPTRIGGPKGPEAPRSVKHAIVKFNSMSGQMTWPLHVFDDLRGWWDEFPNLPEGASSCIFLHRDQLTKQLQFAKQDCWLIEAIEYEDGWIHLFLSKKTGCLTRLRFAERPLDERIDGVTFAAFFTDDDPYRDFMPRFVENYTKATAKLPIDMKFNLAWFGEPDRCPVEPTGQCRIWMFPKEKFQEAFANNIVLGIHDLTFIERRIPALATSHIFKLDGDTFLTGFEIEKVMDKYLSLPNHGVVNLKEDETTGPGLLFANTMVMQRNSFFPKWPGKFYHGDTEFLMNFSRMGIVPLTIFLKFDREDHERPLLSSLSVNWPFFGQIIREGRPTLFEDAEERPEMGDISWENLK